MGRAAFLYRGLWCVVSMALGASPGVRAQEGHWQLDLTGSRIEFDTASATNAPSLAGLGEFQNRWFLGRLSGGLTGFESGAWSARGRIDASVLASPFGSTSPVRLEASGSGGGARHSSSFESLLGRGDLRIHLAGSDGGVWAGLSATGGKNSFDTSFVSGTAPSVGLWGRRGAFRGSASYQHVGFEGQRFPEASLTASHSSRYLDMTVYGGFREASSELDLDRELWAGGSLEAWFQPQMAVVLSVGNYPGELFQDLPGGRYVSIGFRIADRRKRRVPERSLTNPIVFSAADASEGAISFDLEGATMVEIAGDWNAWIPTRLRRTTSGRWALELDLEPGVYRFSLRINGNEWLVPEEAPSMDDGFGGRVGLLIVS